MSDEVVFRDNGTVGLEVVRRSFAGRRHSVVRLMGGQPGAVCVAVREGRLLLGRQPRPAVGAELWEFPRGMGEPGESAVQTATRELVEETGLGSLRAREIGTVYADSGVLANAVAVVEIQVADPQSADTDDTDGELAEVRWITEEAIGDWIRGGRLRDGLTLAAFSLWQHSSP